MSIRNLLEQPCWHKADLGQAMPDSPHAVSVALPTWEDVIAYEEHDPLIVNSLKAVYPRFGLNPLVKEVAEIAKSEIGWEDASAWPYPSLKAAQKAELFCQEKNINGRTTIKELLGLQFLITDSQVTQSAKAFWQHTGLGASSRLAAIALRKEPKPSEKETKLARTLLLNRLGEIYCCSPNNVSLHPSGMAALSNALEVIKQINPKKPTLQLGFPYVDVLKLPQVVFQGSHLCLKKKPEEIAAELEQKQPSALIVEIPSNPMLQCVDLITISKLAHERGIPVIADDTIGSALNIDVLPYADLIFSSLTKSFAGQGDILAGSLVVSPQSKWEKEFVHIIRKNSHTSLSGPDTIALEKASRDVVTRTYQLNKSCLILKRRLEIHPAIERILHPEECPNFKKIMKDGAGYGCLLSFELKGGLEKTKEFYDSIKVCKGPSLGTNFTLACPYVLLAHYNELDWAASCGVPAHLMRVSVGLERPENLWVRFEKALQL